MIIFIEGPRNCGKTHLINKYLEQNQNPNIVYYKFQYAKYLQTFGIHKYENGPGGHYFSLGNILSILEMQNTFLKDKILLFDRAIISAYTWVYLRERMPDKEWKAEFLKILDSELYRNCHTLFVDRHPGARIPNRTKDSFDKYENYDEEIDAMTHVITSGSPSLYSNGNTLTHIDNDYTEDSVTLFNKSLDLILYKNK